MPFFERLDDSGGADTQDPNNIAHTAAVERHVDNLRLDRWQSSFVVVLHEQDAPRTIGVVTRIALGPVGLPAVLHHLETLTRRTLDVHKSPGPSPTATVTCVPVSLSRHQLK